MCSAKISNQAIRFYFPRLRQAGTKVAGRKPGGVEPEQTLQLLHWPLILYRALSCVIYPRFIYQVVNQFLSLAVIIF